MATALFALAAAYTAPPVLDSGLLAVGGQTDESPVLLHKPARLGTSARVRKLQQQQDSPRPSCLKCGQGGNCCGVGGTWEDTCVSHVLFPDEHSWADGLTACKEASEERSKKANSSGVQKPPETRTTPGNHTPVKPDSCPSCGEDDNCCGTDGAWEGKCPKELSWEDGYASCEVHRKTVRENSCSQCGEEFNCCNEGGSWHGSCPMLHTYDEGYESCTAKRAAYWDAEASKIDSDGKYRMTHWASQQALNHLFKQGEPSSDLEKVGLTVHCFDDTERVDQPWVPCDNGWCYESGQWWSGSIINSHLRGVFGDGGIIMAPSHVSLQCSFDSDSGTIFSGCKNGVGSEGFFGPNSTKEMMLSHMNGNAEDYNEVIIDSAEYTANLPKSIAGVIYGLKLGKPAAKLSSATKSGLKTSSEHVFDKVRAVSTYVMILDRYNLTEKDLPLLRANFDPKDVSGGELGLALVDESSSAREFLSHNPYEPALAKWRKGHPYLRDHPERTHKWMRRRNNVRDESEQEGARIFLL